MQTTGCVPVQTPAMQASARVQALRSSQAVPSGLGGVLHVPVAGSQEPASWHWSGAVQTTALPPVQTPAMQRSEEHTSELQSRFDLVCRLLLEKKKPAT